MAAIRAYGGTSRTRLCASRVSVEWLRHRRSDARGCSRPLRIAKRVAGVGVGVGVGMEKKCSTCYATAQQKSAGFNTEVRQEEEKSGEREEKMTKKRRRVLLKVSGEALAGEQGFGIDPVVVQNVAEEVANAVEEDMEVAIVVGGGNFFRGSSFSEQLNIDRASADYMGMLATVMNALSLQSALEHCGVPTRVQTAIEMKEGKLLYLRKYPFFSFFFFFRKFSFQMLSTDSLSLQWLSLTSGEGVSDTLRRGVWLYLVRERAILSSQRTRAPHSEPRKLERHICSRQPKWMAFTAMILKRIRTQS